MRGWREEAPGGRDWWRRGQLGGVWGASCRPCLLLRPSVWVSTPQAWAAAGRGASSSTPTRPHCPHGWPQWPFCAVLSLQAGSRGSQGLTDSLAPLIQFSSPTRHHLGLQEEEVGSANQIGLDVTLVMQLCP